MRYRQNDPTVSTRRRISETSSQSVVQRDIRLYTAPETVAFHGADVIQYSRYVRNMAAGGNHFFSNNFVSSIIQQIIAGETRANIGILLTNSLLAGAPLGLTDETFEHWIDNGINVISNDARNRWNGHSTIGPNAVTADLSPVHAERLAARAYKNELTADVIATFGAKGVAIPAAVTAMLAQAEGVLHAVHY